MSDRTTTSVLAHIQAERAMQKERYPLDHDRRLADETWDALITARLIRPGPRYVRLVQVAALAVAAAERCDEA